MARPLARDEEGLGTFGSLIGVLVLVVVILGAYFGYIAPRFPPAPIRTQPGDEITVHYIGTFENGLVFDTSLESVARDNASHPKAFTFSWRIRWEPLQVTVGAGAVVEGFDVGVQGLTEGESTTFSIPPEQAYGPADPSKIFVKPLFESVPVQVTMNATDFQGVYGTEPESGTNVTDPLWTWPATVSVAGSLVTVKNSPSPGQIVRPYGWDAEVVCVDDGAHGCVGEILVHHRLGPADADRTGHETVTVEGRRQVLFVVSAVDVDAGTYTVDYNVSVPSGRTLVFQVTIVDITRSF